MRILTKSISNFVNLREFNVLFLYFLQNSTLAQTNFEIISLLKRPICDNIEEKNSQNWNLKSFLIVVASSFV